MYYFLPFLSKKYTSVLPAENILVKLKELANQADWKLDSRYFTRELSYKVLESEFYDDSFCIVSTKYGLTYGRTSLFPRLLGRIERNRATNQTIVKIEIRPSLSGLLIITIVFILNLCILYIQFSSDKTGPGILSVFFILIIYLSVITGFNKEVKNYLHLIEDCVS